MRSVSKAARLAVLAVLDQTIGIEGYTLQQIADALEVGHRSTIMRDLRLLPAVRSATVQAAAYLKRLPAKE